MRFLKEAAGRCSLRIVIGVIIIMIMIVILGTLPPGKELEEVFLL